MWGRERKTGREEDNKEKGERWRELKKTDSDGV